ncbi:MAG TPA: hypothetical protein VHB21_08210 [Minicystis sp.]|nr:hypothetical protein [Minicystis sp.]
MRVRPVLVACGLVLALPAGCLDRPIAPVEPEITAVLVQGLPSTAIKRIDLLLAIDNSQSMADKQDILASAVPDLVRGLLDPKCVDAAGDAIPDAEQPASPAAPCPGGSTRAFRPVLDVHVGIVSSSLGGHGSNSCSTSLNPRFDDRGHLLDPAKGGRAVPTYRGEGFLAWDPAGTQTPPGEADLGAFDAHLRDLVRGTGQDGCGYESQLESWYRFLVDPEPYGTIGVVDGQVQTGGVDDTLLAERRDFVRPDSLVAIVLLTDENDCSVIESGDNYRVLQGGYDDSYHPPRGRHECETNPDDRCCAPCDQAPADCPDDPTCKVPLDDTTDPYDLRCFDQKRRYGRDYLYPVQRYVDALTKDTVTTRAGKLVANPLFPGAAAGPNGRSAASRLVYLAGIVGVPWQDVARRNRDGQPDLLRGLDADGNEVGGFQTPSEMAARGPWGSTTWDLVLGDPAKHVPPADPLMHESTTPRSGENPVLHAPLAGPSSPPGENPINGHEWNASGGAGGDLEYACVFTLPKPVVCPEDQDCDCDPSLENPLCQDDHGTYANVLYRAKAYPGLRQLEVLKGLGDQGVVASICPAELGDANEPDYGYEPAVGAIVERLKARISEDCLPIALTPDPKTGDVACFVLEAHAAGEPGACACDGPGRRPIDATTSRAAAETRAAGRQDGIDYGCICEVEQLSGDARTACQQDSAKDPVVGGELASGWCYVDPAAGLGDATLVASCPAEEQREIRFVGAGDAAPDATLYITCAR